MTPTAQETEAVLAARKQAGRELARVRRAAGLNQRQLASRVGYSRGQVAGAEAGAQATAMEFWRSGVRAVLFTKAYGRVLAPGLAVLDPALPANWSDERRSR